MVGICRWQKPTSPINDIFPPWWDFVMWGICWVTVIIIIIVIIIINYSNEVHSQRKLVNFNCWATNVAIFRRPCKYWGMLENMWHGYKQCDEDQTRKNLSFLNLANIIVGYSLLYFLITQIGVKVNFYTK